MELYFLRHAIAVERGHPKYKDDAKRPLTAQGAQKMYHAARGMRALGLSFDAILCSPYARARQTAQIVARAFALKKPELHFTNNLTPDAPLAKLCQEIRTHYPQCKNILLVGHQPHLTELVSYLLKSKNPIPIDLKKGGLAHLSWPTPYGHTQAVLNWVLTPSQLCLISPRALSD